MNNAIVLKKEVNSHSRPMQHTVTLRENGEWNCTCEHHKYRGAICKHILEVQDDLECEGVEVVCEVDGVEELVAVTEIPEETPIRGVANVGGLVSIGVELGDAIVVADEVASADEVMPVIVGVATPKVSNTLVSDGGVDTNDAKALSLLKKALQLKEELLNLKETGVDVSESLKVVNDMILEI